MSMTASQVGAKRQIRSAMAGVATRSPTMGRWIRMTLAAFCATNALSALIAQPAGAAVRTVHAGQSIQAAVDAATPGDTIQVDAGTYTGHVTIAKDGITLRGAGYGAGGSSLVPGGPEAQCDSGICVMGRFDEDFHLLRAVRGVHVTGFSVQGFAGSGIVALGDAGSLFDHVLAAKNGNFGITSVFSSGDRYVSNIAYSNDFAGFQIADSPEAHAQLSNNSAYDNRFGIFVLGASIGTVTDNNLHNNCSGLGFFDAGRQGPTKAWVVSGNTVEHNNQQCPGLPEGDPAISGNGIVILGGQHIVLERNVVRSNQRAPGASTSFSGGVVIMTIPDVVPTAPIDDVVVANTIRNNLPADVVYDETGSGVRFVANDCVKSEPNGLCR